MVVHSKDEEGYGANHEANSTKISLDDDGAVLVRL